MNNNTHRNANAISGCGNKNLILKFCLVTLFINVLYSLVNQFHMLQCQEWHKFEEIEC